MYGKFIALLAVVASAVACTDTDGSVVTDVILDKNEVKIVKGSTVQLNADVLPETALDRTVTWSSDNQAVAFVDQTGLVEAIAPGTANISAEAGGKTAVCEVTVSAVPVESVLITNGDEEGTQLSVAEIQRTNTLQLTVVVTPAEVLGAEYTAIWKSSDEKVATVDDKGLVTAVAKSGESLITVTVGDKTADCKVTALPRSIDFLMANEASKSLKIGETWQMEISGSPADNDDTVSWASSNESVATVSNGLVTAVGKGNVKITAKSTLSPKAHYAECDLMVYGDEVALDMKFVTIPAGEFWMGSPDGKSELPKEPNRLHNETRHKVTITKSFQIGVYEVTNAQYAKFLNETGVKDDGKYSTTKTELLYESSGSCDWGLHYDSDAQKWIPVPGYDNYPVIFVNWYGASEFAEWAGGTLPTEAQWEYACRGGKDDLPFGIGDGKHLDGTMANYQCTKIYDYDKGGSIQSDSDAKPLYKTCEVGSYQPNAYGLYDMHGNVCEWCSDYFVYDLGPDADIDPAGPDTSQDGFRVVKGGNWYLSSIQCRSAAREGCSPAATATTEVGSRYGFRIVKPVE